MKKELFLYLIIILSIILVFCLGRYSISLWMEPAINQLQIIDESLSQKIEARIIYLDPSSPTKIISEIYLDKNFIDPPLISVQKTILIPETITISAGSLASGDESLESIDLAELKIGDYLFIETEEPILDIFQKEYFTAVAIKKSTDLDKRKVEFGPPKTVNLEIISIDYDIPKIVANINGDTTNIAGLAIDENQITKNILIDENTSFLTFEPGKGSIPTSFSKLETGDMVLVRLKEPLSEIFTRDDYTALEIIKF
jgi:hypothetical protein